MVACKPASAGVRLELGPLWSDDPDAKIIETVAHHIPESNVKHWRLLLVCFGGRDDPVLSTRPFGVELPASPRSFSGAEPNPFGRRRHANPLEDACGVREVGIGASCRLCEQ